MSDMDEYLEKGGFKKHNIYNYKNSFYLCNRLDDDNYVVYVQGNAIKHYMKKVYDITMKTCPSEVFIMKYNDKMTIKVIDVIGTRAKLKTVPYNKVMYDVYFQKVPNTTIEYAIKLPSDGFEHDIVYDIFQTYNITVLHEDSHLDLWLDKI